MDRHLINMKTPDINAIKAKHRQDRRETFHRGTRATPEDFDQTKPLRQQILGAIAPIVEISGNDQRRAGIDVLLEVTRQRRHLPPARPAKERKVDTDTMHNTQARQLDTAMQ